MNDILDVKGSYKVVPVCSRLKRWKFPEELLRCPYGSRSGHGEDVRRISGQSGEDTQVPESWD